MPFAVCAARLEYGGAWNPKLCVLPPLEGGQQDFGLEDPQAELLRPCECRGCCGTTIFYRMDGTLKFILRPHQMRAVEDRGAWSPAGA
ncbi:MAG: hypothetical protein H6644_03460 [Caldilineaceae bacterium]|nr:hypothetical protein [Caldilineaceae bacterium]